MSFQINQTSERIYKLKNEKSKRGHKSDMEEISGIMRSYFEYLYFKKNGKLRKFSGKYHISKFN